MLGEVTEGHFRFRSYLIVLLLLSDTGSFLRENRALEVPQEDSPHYALID